jgi:putative nucleotidyltransferase with HDIG domain
MWGRVRQFREAKKPPSPGDFALAEAHLSGPLLDLFRRQHPRDIVHAAATARWLIERGHNDPDLLTAALLHDIGKGHQRRRDRAGYVLASAVRGAKLLASQDSRFELRRAVARSLSHAESGAGALTAVGASPRVVDLTLRHHSPPGSDTMLALLQEADAAS